jgi:hypothetical protein
LSGVYCVVSWATWRSLLGVGFHRIEDHGVTLLTVASWRGDLVSIKYISSFLWISEIYITHKKQESGELFYMKSWLFFSSIAKSSHKFKRFFNPPLAFCGLLFHVKKIASLMFVSFFYLLMIFLVRFRFVSFRFCFILFRFSCVSFRFLFYDHPIFTLYIYLYMPLSLPHVLILYIFYMHIFLYVS